VKPEFLYIFLFFTTVSFAQVNDSIRAFEDDPVRIQQTVQTEEEYDPLAPATAAFYSAVLPGLGQAYNKKYWKIPVVYAGMAAGIYFYNINDKDYNRFRDAYKRRLAGYQDDEFWGDGEEPLISSDRLINAQRTSQKNKSVSLMVAIGFYLLNIIDANVDAHLKQYEVREDLSLQPSFDLNPVNSKAQYGLSLTFRLN